MAILIAALLLFLFIFRLVAILNRTRFTITYNTFNNNYPDMYEFNYQDFKFAFLNGTDERTTYNADLGASVGMHLGFYLYG